jgi:hypothetical protein
MGELEPQLEWKFGELLEREGVTVNRLYEEAKSAGVSRNALYRWTKETPERLDLSVLAHALIALSKLKGKLFSVSDVMDLQANRALGLAYECARIMLQAEEELTEEINRSHEMAKGAPIKDEEAIRTTANLLLTDSPDAPHVRAFNYAKEHGTSKASPFFRAIGFFNLLHWDLATYRAPAEDVLEKVKPILLAYSKTENLTQVPSTKKNFVKDLRRAAAEGLIAALKKARTARDSDESDIGELYDLFDAHYLSRGGDTM